MGEVSQCPSVSRSLRGGLLLYVAATDGQGPNRLIWRNLSQWMMLWVTGRMQLRSTEIHGPSGRQPTVDQTVAGRTLFSESRGTRVLQKKT